MKRCFSRGPLLCLTFTGISVVHAAQPLRLAVTEFSFGAKTESLRDDGAKLNDLLTARLSREAQFQLVERVELDRVLKEKALSVSGLTQPGKAVQIGKLVKADWLCLPSFQNIEGTNYVFAKIVDVNSGAIRDITSVTLERTNLVATAEALATFLISSRSYVQTPKDRVFVAFGAFQNLGINSRYAGFGDRLRAAMARRFQGTRIAVVERSQVTPLLNEIRLAAGGLTQPANKAASIQPAFFIVDGYYQSFYDTESKINIVLCIEMPGNRKQTFSIRELPEAVENKIAASIQMALTNVATVSVSQRDEARLQVRRGSGFVGFVSPTAMWPSAGMPVLDNSPRRKQALKDAISAFESALLLDPEYVTAKQYLARCLADPNINQLERARDLWREVIATTTNAAQMKVARREFAKSYLEVDDAQSIELLSAMQSESTNQTEIASFDRDLDMAYRRIGNRVPTQQKLEFAVESWRRRMRSVEQQALQNGSIPVYASFRGGEWSQLYSAVKGDRPAKVAQVETVVSNFMAEFPKLRPYLLGGFIEWHGGTIPSAGRESVWDTLSPSWKAWYEEMLADCEQGTNRVFREPTFYVDSLWRDLQMFVRHKDLAIAERLANLLQKNGRQYFARAGLDELDLYTGYLLFQQERWADAAAVFDRVGNREVRTLLAGPWGKSGVASGRVAADVCRQRIAGNGGAQAAASGPEIIPAPKPVKAFRAQELIFKCEDSKLWVADGTSLLEFNPDSGEVNRFALPVTPSEMNSSSSFAGMLIAGGKLWIGTHRDGLIAFDPFSRTLTNYTVNSGLMMNVIAGLHVHQDRLWIGYGGGVGYYDLRDRRFVGMMNELPVALGGGPSSIVTSNQSREAAAPRASFHAFANGPSNTLWAATLWGGLFSFDAKSNRWNSATLPCRCQSASLAIAGKFLVVPCYEPTSWSDRDTEFGGLLIYDSAKRDCKHLGVGNGLPDNHLRSVAVDGTKAWVGGRGFVALVDLP
ncbi:MAG TPA: CsgG/HfaB family protein, partial [Candidatus Eisenbacteria bacterium]|nr:CsgG/HfaB family protein [Candidatus Eisenbacteria bacterium]